MQHVRWPVFAPMSGIHTLTQILETYAYESTNLLSTLSSTRLYILHYRRSTVGIPCSGSMLTPQSASRDRESMRSSSSCTSPSSSPPPVSNNRQSLASCMQGSVRLAEESKYSRAAASTWKEGTRVV